MKSSEMETSIRMKKEFVNELVCLYKHCHFTITNIKGCINVLAWPRLF